MTPVAKAADTPFSGKYCTWSLVLEWLRQHPEYSPSRYYEKCARDHAEEQEFLQKMNQPVLACRQRARGVNRSHRAA